MKILGRRRRAQQGVRLSVNINDETARALRRRCATDDISITEAVRRAIGTWDFVAENQARGMKFELIDRRNGYRQVFWLPGVKSR